MRKRKEKKIIVCVAGNIRKYRMEIRFTQEQLEEATGLPIARYESGRNDMTLTTLSILSRHLDVEPYQLLK